MDGYCLEEHNNWSLFNMSTFIYQESLTTNCSSITDVCCSEIEISSVNSNNETFFNELPKESLGIYKAIGMINGRYAYQKENHDRYLEYGSRHWLVSKGISKTVGSIHHPGGSVCPEHIKNEWQIAYKNRDDQWLWKDDPMLEITCAIPVGTLPNFMQGVATTSQEGYKSTAILFGVLTALLLVLMCIYFARRCYRAWVRGAHGKNLIFETLDLPH